MSEFVHIVCPSCHAKNRLPKEKDAFEGKCGKCKAALFNGKPLILDTNGFNRHIAGNDIPILVDFWASWCGPCKMMAPVLEDAAGKLRARARIAKVNTEEEQALSSQYGIRSIPTLVLFKGGKEADRLSGALDLTALLTWLHKRI